MSYGTAEERPEEAIAERTQPDVRLDEPAGDRLPADPAALLYPAEAAHILEGCGDPRLVSQATYGAQRRGAPCPTEQRLRGLQHAVETLHKRFVFPTNRRAGRGTLTSKLSSTSQRQRPGRGLLTLASLARRVRQSSTGLSRLSLGPTRRGAREPAEVLRNGRPPDEPAGRPLPADPAALLYPLEAAHILGLSPRTLEHYRIAGGGPRYVSIGRRCVRYRRSDLIDWIDSRCRRHRPTGGITMTRLADILKVRGRTAADPCRIERAR